jgi:hypothetical protein
VGRRSASEAKITQDFQETALQGYTVMNLTRQYPAFGGEAVVTFGQPHLQEMTTPGVKTSDDFSLRGTFDATEFAKSLSWRTVSWAQVSCQAVNAPPDGTCVTRFLSHQIGLGKESEIHGNRVTETKTSLELAVDGGAFGRSAPSASASGTLVTEGPAGKIDEQPLIHSYQMDTADNGPVTVKQTYGSNQTHFEIYRLDKDGRKVGLETRTEHVDVGIPFPVKMPRP